MFFIKYKSHQNRTSTIYTKGIQSSICHLNPFFGFLKILLCLSKLGKVKSCNLLGFLNLLLIDLYLVLKLAGQFRHLVLIFPILFLLEQELLDSPFCLLISLHILRGSNLGAPKLMFQLSYLNTCKESKGSKVHKDKPEEYDSFFFRQTLISSLLSADFPHLIAFSSASVNLTSSSLS